MGNTIGSTEMKTWTVSQTMSMNHHQLRELRDVCFQDTPEAPTTLTHLQLMSCLERTSISSIPDAEIILKLFAMWDVNNTDQIAKVPFLLSLCPLACNSNETHRSFLRFVLKFFDVNRTGYILEEDLIMILESLNMTVGLLGDTPLSRKRLHNVVNDVVESALLANKENTREKLILKDVVNLLEADPWIQRLLSQEISNSRVTFASAIQDEERDAPGVVSKEDESAWSTESDEDLISLRARTRCDSDETWDAEHPGFPRFKESENIATDLEPEVQCMLGMGFSCMPAMLVL